LSQGNGGGGGGNARRRRGRRSSPRRFDVWRDSPDLGDPSPIVLAADPTALLHSLGPPPLQGRSTIAEFYLEEVVKAAQRHARVLAWTAGVLDEHPGFPDAEAEAEVGVELDVDLDADSSSEN
jgi:hypothetical protein